MELIVNTQEKWIKLQPGTQNVIELFNSLKEMFGDKLNEYDLVVEELKSDTNLSDFKPFEQIPWNQPINPCQPFDPPFYPQVWYTYTENNTSDINSKDHE